jgi:hypothetical protein
MCSAPPGGPDRRHRLLATAGTDLALIGSDDRSLYAEIGRPHQDRRVPIRRLLAAEARAVFEGFAAKRDG